MATRELELVSRTLPLLLRHATAKGVDVGAVLARHGFSPELVAKHPRHSEIRVMSDVLRAASEELAALTGDEHLGLAAASATPRGSYGLAEFVVRSVTTVREAFQQFVRLNMLVSQGLTFVYEETEEEGILNIHEPVRPALIGQHAMECIVGLAWATLKNMAPQVTASRVWFPWAAPASSMERYSAHFGPEALVEFGQTSAGFAVPASFLSITPESCDPALNAFLREQADAALASRPKTNDLVDRLRHMIEATLKEGEPNVERLAKRLHLSARTLQRRLTEQKTSFQTVLDDVRYDLAQGYLKDDRLDVSEVAYLLGYGELRAFDRAFKRWAGLTPKEWRMRGRSVT